MIIFLLFWFCNLSKIEATLEIEYLSGSRGERIIKELALVSDDVIQTYHFRPPYFMTPHSSKEKGLTWNDGHIPYD